ncbi:MAG: hypothetical protein ACRDGS_02885, partial [Chloroflexota bacterium]
MSGSGSKQRVHIYQTKPSSTAASPSSAKQASRRPADSVGYLQFLQRTAGNTAVSEYLRSNALPSDGPPVAVQRKGPLDWLLGKGKQKEAPLVLSGPSGGRSGKVDNFGENKASDEVSYSDYPKDPVTFFQNVGWRAHFLQWLDSGQFAGVATAPLLEVFVQANLRRLDGDALTRQQALDFIDSVLAPRASDPAVAKIVAAREGGGNGLDGLRELVSTDEYFKQGKVVSRVGEKEVRGMSGKKVLDGKATKLYYNVVDLFNGYRAMLDSPEGKRDQSRPLTPAQFPVKPSLTIGGGRQRGRADWTAAVAPDRGPRGRFLDTRPSKPPTYAPPPIPTKKSSILNSLPDPSTLGPLPPIPGTRAVRPLPPIPVPKVKPPRPPRTRWQPVVNDP